MRFLWKSQLLSERGKLLPKSVPERNRVGRKERLAAHSKEKPQSFLLVVSLWLIFFGTMVYLVLFSSYLALGPWRITGFSLVAEPDFRQTVDEQLAHRYLGLVDRNRFFLLRPAALAQTIKERYPLIKDVSVQRIFPDGLGIAVTEREMIVLWCAAGECAQILEDGSVVAITAAYGEPGNQERTITLSDESGQPIAYGPGVFDGDFVSRIMSLRHALRDDFAIETDNDWSFASRFADELRLKTVDGYGIYFATRLPLEASLSALRLLFDQEIPLAQRPKLSYIDLRTENRIFYLYRDGAVEPQEISTSARPVPEKKSSGEKTRE